MFNFVPRFLKDLVNKQSIKSGYDAVEIVDYIKNDQINILRDKITIFNSFDQAEILNLLKEDQFCSVISRIIDILNPEVIVSLYINHKIWLIDALGIDMIVDILEKLSIDEIIDFVSDFEDELQNEILKFISRSTRKKVKLSLQYKDNEVGRFMETDFASIHKSGTVSDIKKILSNNDLSDDIHDIFVVDDENKIIGMITLLSILQSSDARSVMSILNNEFNTIDVNAERSDIAYIFRKYNITTLPVINKNSEVIGFISLSTAHDILTEESDEDLLRLSGVIDGDEKSLAKNIGIRSSWLFINLIFASIAASVIGKFESTISKYSFLAAMIPIASSLGGNAGMQTAGITIRMITMQTINKVNKYSIMMREILIGFANSLIMVVICYVLSYIFIQNAIVSFIFATAVASNTIFAAFFGFTVPILMQKFKLDPAMTSPIILTSITDGMGFALFLSLAKVFLDK